MKFNGYIFDLDGTIYLGENLLPHAAETIQALRHSNKKVLFLSNKPIESRENYANKLTRLGIETHIGEVINSSFVSMLYFGKHHPNARIYVIGEELLKQELVSAGLHMAEQPTQTDIVLISLDRDVSYAKIHFAYHAAKAGAQVWATNPDLVCPMPGDEIIDAGATIAAIEALLRRKIDGVIGKPSPIMVQTVLKHLNLHAAECLMVGDRLETDILMGINAGMSTALMLTGVTLQGDIDRLGISPDYVFQSLSEILAI